MKNFLKIFNYSTIVFAVSSVHLFAQNPVSSSPSSDKPINQNNQANFQEMHQKRKENREKIQGLKDGDDNRVINQNSQNQGGSRGGMGSNTQNQGHHDHSNHHDHSKMDRREDKNEKRGNGEDIRDHREEYREDATASGNQQQNRRIENKQAMPENQSRNKNEGSSRDSRGGKKFNNQASPQQERAPR